MDIFKTKNLFVASYLLASGKVRFLGIESADSKTKLFRFTPSSVAEKLESDYFTGGLLPVKIVFSEYNTLKDVLFGRDAD